MAALRKPIVYLTVSFALFMVAPMLISIGTTSGPRLYLWIGLGALTVGSLIPPAQRLVSRLLPQRREENRKDNVG